MRYANVAGQRIAPIPGFTNATCPACDAPVLPKCGRVVTWHWAHRVADCDPWAEPDTQWHRDWQELVPADRREVVIGPHRADIVTPQGRVVEIQHSNLSVDDIHKREMFYGNDMIWIFDARDAYRQDRFDLRTSDRNTDPRYRTFRWKHARKSIAACRAQVWLDIGYDRIFRLDRIYPEAPVGGWGFLFTKDEVVEAINQ